MIVLLLLWRRSLSLSLVLAKRREAERAGRAGRAHRLKENRRHGACVLIADHLGPAARLLLGQRFLDFLHRGLARLLELLRWPAGLRAAGAFAEEEAPFDGTDLLPLLRRQLELPGNLRIAERAGALELQ